MDFCGGKNWSRRRRGRRKRGPRTYGSIFFRGSGINDRGATYRRIARPVRPALPCRCCFRVPTSWDCSGFSVWVFFLRDCFRSRSSLSLYTPHTVGRGSTLQQGHSSVALALWCRSIGVASPRVHAHHCTRARTHKRGNEREHLRYSLHSHTHPQWDTVLRHTGSFDFFFASTRLPGEKSATSGKTQGTSGGRKRSAKKSPLWKENPGSLANYHFRPDSDKTTKRDVLPADRTHTRRNNLVLPMASTKV